MLEYSIHVVVAMNQRLFFDKETRKAFFNSLIKNRFYHL